MILIVDDVPDTCEVMSRLLGRAGYTVKAVQSAKEALALLRDADGPPPQLIILDVMMPEMDGASLLRAIREDERLKSVPVLICTADSSYTRLAEMMGLGAQAQLVKGRFDRECLYRCVEHFGGPPQPAVH